MRLSTTLTFGIVFGTSFSACGGDDFGDCRDTSTCPRDGGGATGGTSGTSGSGGSSASGGSMGSGGSSGSTGTGGASGTDSGVCDATKSPSEDPCVIDEAYGVFVAPSGSDTNIGSRELPFKTIAAAVAASQGKRIYVCSATYTDPLTLNAPTQIVHIYGGFACPDQAAPWSYSASQRPVIAPTAPGYALRIQNATPSIHIEDVSFVAANAVAAGESSIAAFVSDSPNVRMRRVRLEAGTGKDGENAVNPGFMYPTPLELSGKPGTATQGGSAESCTCPGSATSRGGLGGGPGQNGGLGFPDLPGLGGEGGDYTKACTGIDGGGSGAEGAPAEAPRNSPGATAHGTLGPAGFSPNRGTNGTHGTPGQGGGGGGGKTEGGGGSGGCGGCGGQSGPGGGGGGASIALLALNAPVTLASSELITANAGRGGNGAAGQAGQAGGGRGRGFGTTPSAGCDGGNGGTGAAGSAGGGGAGGVSVGVVFRGATPLVDAATQRTTGTAGPKGIGGQPGENDGVAGIAGPDLEIAAATQ